MLNLTSNSHEDEPPKKCNPTHNTLHEAVWSQYKFRCTNKLRSTVTPVLAKASMLISGLGLHYKPFACFYCPLIHVATRSTSLYTSP
jgi:hypothetical protein